ncbi:MAG: pyridoxal-phosphate dependent enzyme [Daejeonella sp.]
MIDLQFYSPEEEIFNPIFGDKNIRVFVKRDDLIHPFISGNKWRKLKYNLQEAKKLNKTHLITFGGAYSNHLLATAAASAKFGFKSTAFVRGEKVENQLLVMCRLFGLRLIFTEREAYRDKQKLFNSHFGADEKAFFIDEGGSGELAVKGVAELVDELEQQYDHLFCASGTGTTAAGILRGLKSNNLNTKLHAVPVLKGGEFIRTEILGYNPGPNNLEVHLDYHFGGYAKTSPELLKFIQTFSSSSGILIDPVYTAKLFFALFNLIENNYFDEGSKILAIHTGGLFGLLGMTEKLEREIR